MLRCGVSTETPGMSMPDSQGRWTGFHADICPALAIAVLRDPSKVRFVPVTATARFTALQTGEIDVLSSTTALPLNRDTWQKRSGSNTRARAEAAVTRWKQVIGDGLRSRKDERRAAELAVAVHALNRMLAFGRPISVRIA